MNVRSNGKVAQLGKEEASVRDTAVLCTLWHNVMEMLYRVFKKSHVISHFACQCSLDYRLLYTVYIEICKCLCCNAYW